MASFMFYVYVVVTVEMFPQLYSIKHEHSRYAINLRSQLLTRGQSGLPSWCLAVDLPNGQSLDPEDFSSPTQG